MAVSGTALLIAAGIAAVAAGTAAYLQSEEAARQRRSAAKMAELQQQAEDANAEAARKNSRLKSRRMLNAQASKAGGAGVVAGEGSLFVNQMEAASLAQYEEDLAAYGHEINSNLYGYQSKLFKNDARRIQGSAVYTSLLAGAQAGASTYFSGGGKIGGGGTVATTGGVQGVDATSLMGRYA